MYFISIHLESRVSAGFFSVNCKSISNHLICPTKTLTGS